MARQSDTSSHLRYAPVARTPMLWTTGPNGGVSTPEPRVTPGLGEPGLAGGRPGGGPRSLVSFSRPLTRLRCERPALAVGAYRPLPAAENVLAFERWHPEGAIQVHLNLGPSSREIDLGGGRVLVSTAGPVADQTSERPILSLDGYEGVVVDMSRL